MKSSSWFFLLSILGVVHDLGACGSDFEPASYLNDPRVLAVLIDPIEPVGAQAVTLRPVVYLPATEMVSEQSWVFCPFSLGPASGYRCALEACESIFAPTDGNGALWVEPAELLNDCIQKLTDNQPPVEGFPDELGDKVTLYFRYILKTSGGLQREAVVPVTWWVQNRQGPPNRQPVISAMEIASKPVSTQVPADPVFSGDEVEVAVRVDSASLDSYVDDAGRTQTEEAVVALYATAGRFEYDLDTGVDVRIRWKAEKLESGQNSAHLWAVVRDLRGGQAVYGPVEIPIIR